MKNRHRLAVAIILALVSTLLTRPVSAEDIVIEYAQSTDLSGCTGRIHHEYTSKVASWVVYFTRGRDDCDYRGDLAVTATLARESANKWTTVTAVTVCPALQNCEARVSMPHPELERAGYDMEWTFLGNDSSHGGWSWYWQWRWTGIHCESYYVMAHCGLTQYAIIHAPG